MGAVWRDDHRLPHLQRRWATQPASGDSDVRIVRARVVASVAWGKDKIVGPSHPSPTLASQG
jgi:hypothetical protein